MTVVEQTLIDKVFDFLGRENVLWFKHIKGLKGNINCILRLNFDRKHIPIHPIHLREGMQIRNFLRKQPECKGWNDFDYDELWIPIVEKCFEKLNTQI